MKIAALYCRVSTDRQEQQETILSQVAEVEAKIVADGNILRDNLRFIDDGWSGMVLERPGLDAMRDATARKQFDVLYVYDRGRLARKYSYQEVILEEIYDKEIEFVTLHDFNALTAEDRVLQAMQGVFHEYERVKIAERMRRGKLFKVKNGNLFGWEAPYGFKYIKQDGIGSFLIDEEQAEIVRMIFSWIAEDGLTIRKVIKKLYELQIKPKKSKKGFWSTGTLSRMLRDQSYIGLTHYNKRVAVIPMNPTNQEKYRKIKKSSRKMRPKDEWYPIKVPAIINNDLFNKAQKQLEVNNQFSMRNKKNDYLLSGLVYCACGKKRSGEGNSKNGHLYYRCCDRILRFPLPRECKAMGANSIILDSLVWKNVSALLQNPELIKKQAQRWLTSSASHVNNTPSDVEVINTKIKKLDEEEQRYLKAYGKSVITLEQYVQHKDEIESKKSALIARVQSTLTPQPSQRSLPVNLPELCAKITELLEDIPFGEMQIVLRKVIEKVTTDGKTAKIQGYVPVAERKDYAQNVKFWSISRNCWSS